MSETIEIPGYRLLEKLGSGGMATVYLAVQTSLDRKVAIKVMRRDLTDENLKKRYLLEGRTMARLPHRNIAAIHDIVQDDSISYISMEFLEGGSLTQRMRQGLSVAQAVAIVVQLASALQFAHENGIVHRDLKPSNIMFRDRATPVLTDFGIAREQDAKTTRLTQTGMLVGTPVYMSPEQVDGSDVDGRSDQYALGVLFYEMLTGSPPFDGDTPVQVLMAHINTPPRPLPAAFAPFQPLLDRMLAKRPDDRFEDLREFSRCLRAIVTDNPDLQAQLYVDPTETMSEQLRALGFSESQIQTGADRSPPAPTRQMPPKAPQGSGVGRLPGGKPVWLTGAAIVVVVAVIAAWMLPTSVSDQDPDSGDRVAQTLPRADEPTEADKRILDRQARASLLVERADQAIAQGRLHGDGDDNALKLLSQALQIAPQHIGAQQAYDDLVDSLLEPAREAVDQDQLEEAARLLDDLAAQIGDESAWLAVKDNLDGKRDRITRRARINAWLVVADSQISAGNFAEPPGGNALETLMRITTLEPENRSARALLERAGWGLVRLAREAEQSGDYLKAMTHYDRALQAVPEQARWRQERARIAESLGDLEGRVAGALSRAREAIAQQRFLQPPGENAYQALTEVLTLDPGNSEASQQLDQLPRLIYETALSMEADNQMQAAIDLLESARARFPDVERIDELHQRLSLNWQETQRRQQRREGVERLRELLAQRHISGPIVNEVAEVLAGLHALDPNDDEVNRIRASFMAGLGHIFESVDAPDKLVGLNILMQPIERHLGRDADDVQALRLTLQQTRDRLEAEQRWRATRELALVRVDPRPWALLESVSRVDSENGSKHPVEGLEVPPSTPLNLRLPAGEYQLSLRHPQQAQTIELNLSVAARDDISIRPQIPLAQPDGLPEALDLVRAAPELESVFEAFLTGQYSDVVAIDSARIADEQSRAVLLMLHAAAFWSIAELGDEWARDAALSSLETARSSDAELRPEGALFPPRFQQFWQENSDE